MFGRSIPRLLLGLLCPAVSVLLTVVFFAIYRGAEGEEGWYYAALYCPAFFALFYGAIYRDVELGVRKATFASVVGLVLGLLNTLGIIWVYTGSIVVFPPAWDRILLRFGIGGALLFASTTLVMRVLAKATATRTEKFLKIVSLAVGIVVAIVQGILPLIHPPD